MQSQQGLNTPCNPNIGMNNTTVSTTPVQNTVSSASSSLEDSLNPYHDGNGQQYHNYYPNVTTTQPVEVLSSKTCAYKSSPPTSAAATTTPAPKPAHEPHDDLDLLLRHVDFPKLVRLAIKVKQVRSNMVAAECCQHGSNKRAKRSNSALDPAEVMSAVQRLQEQLLSLGPTQSVLDQQVIHRGVYPITDSIVDDSLDTLQYELDRCMRALKQSDFRPDTATTTAQVPVHEGRTTTLSTLTPPASSTRNTHTETKNPKKRSRKKDSIAVKYSKWQTDILMHWMIEHKEDPFPDQNETRKLMQLTNLSQSQVVNWTTNVRKRNRKATCEGGKKPHHFIDFLFLAQDREQREQKLKSPPAPQRFWSDPVAQSGRNVPSPPSYHYQHHPQQNHQELRPERERQPHVFPGYPSPQQLQSSSSVWNSPDLPSLPRDGTENYGRQFPVQGCTNEHAYSNHDMLEPVTSDGIDDDALLEPILLNDDFYDMELLDEFSTFWLQDECSFRNDTALPEAMEGASVHDFITPTTTREVQPLLPSVTDDQDATPHSPDAGRRQKRQRTLSLDFLDDLTEENIQDWAAELGLSIEI